MYVYCIKHLAHVQSYSYSALWRPWVVESCYDLVADVVQSSVCVECLRLNPRFLFMYDSSVFSTVLAMENRSDIGGLCQCCGLGLVLEWR